MPYKISATQLEAAKRCKRRWWFRQAIGLPQPPNRALQYGIALHSACQRYLMADGTGRDPYTGKEIELWPAGWEARLFPAEAEQLKASVEEGIARGILEREPGRRVEYRFHSVPLVRPEDDPAGVGVDLVGQIDLWNSRGVQDHKSLGKIRYAQGPTRLARNLQLLLYAKLWLDDYPEDVSIVEIRHNYFSKNRDDKTLAKKSRAKVTREEVNRFWSEMGALALELDALPAPGDEPEAVWPKVEGPSEKDACNDYGGCPYMRICALAETMEQYRVRIIRMQTEAEKEDAKLMSLFKNKGKGKGKKSNPLKAGKTKASKKPAPEPEDDEDDEPEDDEPEEETPKKARKKRKAKPAPEPEPDDEDDEPEDDDEDEEDDEDEPEEAPKKRGPGRPRKVKKAGRGRGRPMRTFTVCCGCAPIKPIRKTIHGTEILATILGQDTEGYWQKSAYERWDLLRRAELPEIPKGTFVLFPASVSKDLEIVAEMLAEKADEVIVGTR